MRSATAAFSSSDRSAKAGQNRIEIHKIQRFAVRQCFALLEQRGRFLELFPRSEVRELSCERGYVRGIHLQGTIVEHCRFLAGKLAFRGGTRVANPVGKYRQRIRRSFKSRSLPL